MQHADIKLVNKLLDGDEKAFEVFFNSYFHRLFRFVLSRLNHDEDMAADVVQSVLCKAITKLDTYRGEAALYTWLCTFCRYELAALFKKRNLYIGNTEFVEDDPHILSALESLARVSLADPAVKYQQTELARLVQLTLDHLPSLYSDILEWKYVQGLSVKCIATRIQRGTKATESLLTRARHAFRDGFCALLDGEGLDSYLTKNIASM